MDARHPEVVAFERRLVPATELYLDRLADCVEALPRLVEAYRAGREHRTTLAEIRRHESECDAIKLELGRLLSGVDGADSTPPAWDRRHTDRTLELYEDLDAIANAAEGFAGELVAIGPTRCGACLGGLAEMATLAVSAMAELEAVVGAFVRALCRPEGDVSVTDGVSTIRAIEGEADSVRDRVIEAAFTGERDGDAIAYRQLAVCLDGALDAVEDVTDRMHLVAGSEGWPDVEVYPPCGR